ncbi:uncharacterized protein KD926_011642 [Aspergillus affinis]|uniref:uncharacterized protein n=1 Tax=Aspergillus affinis TaxID=1070780 RepID=UPI0022FEEE92|nr:uncharacterized protein KD926_011642 [Aspergillus affinis]KAI9044672.1 hypothetical protein KD926_011642 [Aspergillus affinis]
MQFLTLFSAIALISGAIAGPVVQARDENTVLAYKDECATDGSYGYCDEGLYCKADVTEDVGKCCDADAGWAMC